MRARVLVAALATALAALAGVGAWSVSVFRQLDEAGGELVDTTAYVAQMSSELVTARADGDLLVDMLAVLRAEPLRRIELRGDGSARGRAFLSPRGLVLLVDGLPAPPAGQAYEAWADPGDGEPVSAGTFQVNPFGMASIVRTLPSFAGTEAMTVTLERSGDGFRASRPVLAGP